MEAMWENTNNEYEALSIVIMNAFVYSYNERIILILSVHALILNNT